MEAGLNAFVMVLPVSTQEVSKVLSLCNQLGYNVVPFGGLTNLVGSTKTTPKDVVLSLEKMNVIEEVDVQSRTITCQAGAIIQSIQEAAANAGMLFPLNFGAVGSSQIGGAVSTNAGGLKVLKYGMTRDLVLGLEVVLADGTIITSLKKIVKDNSGYDIKHMFIGAEGTLGVITRVTLKLSEMPSSRVCAYAGINKYKNVVDFLKFMDAGLAGTLSSFEIIWPDSFKAMTGPTASVHSPIEGDFSYYILVEAMGADQNKDEERFHILLSDALEKGMIQNAVPAFSSSDYNWFWKIREDVKVLKDLSPNDQHFDISIPINKIGDYVEKVTEELKKVDQVVTVFTFGHIADGNVHFIIGKSEQNAAVISKVNEVVYAPIQSLNGSVSAEHGIGVDKKEYLHLSRTPEEINLFKLLKSTLDPNGILNRGKII
jgi:FAD/FMN-containing dehydrogenase